MEENKAFVPEWKHKLMRKKYLEGSVDALRPPPLPLVGEHPGHRRGRRNELLLLLLFSLLLPLLLLSLVVVMVVGS